MRRRDARAKCKGTRDAAPQHLRVTVILIERAPRSEHVRRPQPLYPLAKQEGFANPAGAFSIVKARLVVNADIENVTQSGSSHSSSDKCRRLILASGVHDRGAADVTAHV